MGWTCSECGRPGAFDTAGVQPGNIVFASSPYYLHHDLSEVEGQLERIADALESLVEILQDIHDRRCQ